MYNSIDVGGLYHLSDKIRVGLMAKNFIGFSTDEKYSSVALPRYLTLGISRTGGSQTLSLDSEHIFGTFGGLEEKDIKFWLLRGGFEKELTPWATGRIGFIYPVIAETSTIGNIKDNMPSPKIGGSVGLGLRYKSFLVDFSLYGDPVKSYLEQQATLSSVVSITVDL